MEAKVLGRIVWRGYRWCGHTDMLRRSRDFPPLHPRHWTRFSATCIGQWADERRALDWLWNQMAEAHDHIVAEFPQRAVAIRSEYDDAAQRLCDSDDCACSWSIALPASIRLYVGIVAVYEHPSTIQGDT
ncbi:hypothetical protein Snas_5414 [Stackebrandtia nassauensis DSM 44728]|uniref:Uncharacterized protein n=1 Tax=Stackebrandtia nassauensis (strain DSM 44728 / CIP 108903 / NRRL B-16338 / NBRC 102104 / LLR-40K-21) TaxID=446470 RepID=D3PVS5_STANL|nr:hypothetical protein Snas_5414 [Stackebrandtia nassauensis DSM 44728]